MIALREQLQRSPFMPTWRAAFNDYPPFNFCHLFSSNRKNLTLLRGIDKINEESSLERKTVELMKLLYRHHKLSARHSFGVAFIAEELGKNYFSYYKGLEIDPGQILRKIYFGGLLHDVGKLGIDEEILSRKDPLTQEQKEKLKQHGLIGARILVELGLSDYIYFAEDHHIGQNGICQWSQGQLQSRHPLTEIISMADLIDASLDEERKYKKTRTIQQLVKIIHKNVHRGVFSPGLEKAFLKLVKDGPSDQGLYFRRYIPFNNLLQTIPLN